MKSSIAHEPWLKAPETQAVMSALEGERVGEVARFVGGCVRNALLGEPVSDVDIATTLTPDEVVLKLEAAGLKAVPTGIEHGTITAVSDGRPFEITTLRKDVETHGRHATVAFSTDWAEDAARRDFTMNALLADVQGQIYDPLGGRVDLEERRVRFIGNAASRIAEDFLRILRFFRIHAWYSEGELDKEGLEACASAAEHLGELSAERVSSELLKLLEAWDPLSVLRQMAAVGVLGRVLPEAQNFDRFARLAEIERAQFFEPDALLRLGSLLARDQKSATHLGTRLRLSNDSQTRLADMSGGKDKIVCYLSIRDLRRQIYWQSNRTFRDRAMLAWAEDPKTPNSVQWRALIAMADSFTPPEMPLTGDEVMAAGVPHGPEVGRVMREVEEWWVDADFTEDRFSIIERLKAVVQATVF